MTHDSAALRDEMLARISEALATDERTHALDVRVSAAGGAVHLSGQVECQERRRAIEEVAREHLPPEMGLVVDVLVMRFAEPSEAEWLG